METPRNCISSIDVDFTSLGARTGQGSVVAAKKKAAGRRAGNIMAFVGSDEARLKEAAELLRLPLQLRTAHLPHHFGTSHKIPT